MRGTSLVLRSNWVEVLGATTIEVADTRNKKELKTMRTFSTNHVVAALLLITLGVSPAAWASGEPGTQTRSRSEQQRRDGMVKIVAGAATAGLGALFIAASHESVSGQILGEHYSASATNTGGMILGTGLLGAGGYLLYLGMKDRREADARPSIGVSVGRRTGVFVTKRW
jgi:hypothetical protein